jgi:steroid 5-alpha reductase family enzyme
MLKKTSGREYPLINFIGIHMMPTLVVYSCILPAVFAFKYDAQLNMGSIIFFLLSVVATVWQGTADFQMHKFRKSGKGGFIRTGLWKYSRHPNYLGEILMWWGVALSAVSVMPERWYLIGGAVANTCLFLFISIPLADKHQARKEGFEEYRMQTRMLLPITTKRLKQKNTIEKT